MLRAILTSNNDYSSARLNLGWVLFIVIPILGHRLAHKTIAHAVAQQYFGAASPADNYFTLWQNNAQTAQWYSLCGYFFARITDPIPVPVSRLKQPTVTE